MTSVSSCILICTRIHLAHSQPLPLSPPQVKNTKRSEARLEVSQVARFDFYVPKRTPPTRHVNLNTMTESTQDTQYDDENTFDEEVSERAN